MKLFFKKGVGSGGDPAWGRGNIPVRLFKMPSAREEHDECRSDRKENRAAIWMHGGSVGWDLIKGHQGHILSSDSDFSSMK